ncbi:MAG: hypothetical protein AAF607_07890 [Pseudomonadota bacterium]
MADLKFKFDAAALGRANLAGQDDKNNLNVVTGQTIAPVLASPQEPPVLVRKRPMRGCSLMTYKQALTFVLGTRSNCVGGSLTNSERIFLSFEQNALRRRAVAEYALLEDPRRFGRVPRSATAGLRMPLIPGANIGVQYTFGARGEASPFHFKHTGLPDDQVVGHTATLSIGLGM